VSTIHTEAPLQVARRTDQTDLFSRALQTVDEREESARTAVKNIQHIQSKARRDMQSSNKIFKTRH
jgi:hypothetical protein